MEHVAVPVNTPRPTSFTLTDSGDDLHIGLDRLGTFMAEMLVAAHFFEERKPQLPAMRPVLHDWPRERFRWEREPLATPEITIGHTSLQSSKRTLARSLFYSGVSQLVSEYEIYLASLAREIYIYNPELLSANERRRDKQLTNAEILAAGSYDRILNALVERAVFKLTALPYPALVERFNREFRVGIHHATSPATLFTVHHLIEQRHLIVHNNGYVSDQYIERMSAYEGEDILGEHNAISVSFKSFFDHLYTLAALGDYIDGKVKNTWQTSTA